MFSRPSYGWTAVKVGGKIFGNASYLSDPIVDTIEALTLYVGGNSNHLYTYYDGEGYEFGLVTINGQLYVWKDTNKLRLYPVETHDRDKRPQMIAAKLLRKALNNLDDYFEAWVNWHMDHDDPDALAVRRSELECLGDLGRNVLKRLE